MSLKTPDFLGLLPLLTCSGMGQSSGLGIKTPKSLPLIHLEIELVNSQQCKSLFLGEEEGSSDLVVCV